MTRLLRLPLLLTFLAAASCSSDSDDARPDATVIPDTGPSTDTGGFMDATVFVPDIGTSPDLGFPDAGFPDAGFRDDDNDSIAEARRTTKNSFLGSRATIDFPGDRDFYWVDLTEGEWIIITVNSLSEQPVDGVLRLYGPDETLLAENDDGLPRTSVNPEIIYHAGQDGRYYVEVQEFSSWNETDNVDPVGGPTYTYAVRVRNLDPSNAGINIDQEAGDTEAEAQVVDQRAAIVIAGTLEDATDVDVYRFTKPNAEATQTEVLILPPGPNGYGGTSSSVWVATASATPEVLARVPQSIDYNEVAPNLTGGDYLLYVSQPAAPVLANPHYVLKVRFFPTDNPPETEPNDSAATAEVLTLSEDNPRSAFILANLPEGDVDYFAIDVRTNEEVSVACGAENSGSGLRGLLVELLDNNEQVVGTSTETPPLNAFIQPVQVPFTGRWLVRLSTTEAPAVNGGRPFVRCGIRAAP